MDNPWGDSGLRPAFIINANIGDRLTFMQRLKILFYRPLSTEIRVLTLNDPGKIETITSVRVGK